MKAFMLLARSSPSRKLLQCDKVPPRDAVIVGA
jgi:hypothetical protein